MVKRKYDYEYYLGSSKKLKNFLDLYKDKAATHRAYKLHLVRYFQTKGIEDIDNYVKDKRMMDKEEKIKYLDKLEQDLTDYWKKLNEEYKGKAPYVWISAIKMFLIFNKTFELDNVYIDLQKSGHGNYTRTDTGTPTRTQLLKIFSYSNPESKALFMFQLTSGQRIGDVIETTFDNIEMKHECPRVFYPDPKQKYVIKTRITPETKQLLKEYLEQRNKFIETRIKRGEHKRKKKLDMNRVFPMDKGTANAIWNTMLKNAGLYKLDPNTKRPVYGTHCLRRYFLSYFKDRDWGDFFSGHITPRNKEYRQYPHEKLDEKYKEHMKDLIVFETPADLTEINKEIAELRKENEELNRKLDKVMRSALINKFLAEENKDQDKP